MVSFVKFAVLLTLMSAGPACANFLRTKLVDATPGASAAQMEASLEEVREAFLSELQGALGGNSSHTTATRLKELEAALRPMYSALPKTGEGLLGHNAVRYALHRYFAQRHGWSVKGLDPAGGHWNSSSPSMLLQDRVPGYLQEQFEQRLRGHGLSLHDLAGLAATLEHLVHEDALKRLRAAYSVLNLPASGEVKEQKALEAIDVFMMMFVLGQDITHLTHEEVLKEFTTIDKVYPGWSDTQAFVRGVIRNVTGPSRPFAHLSLSGGKKIDFSVAQKAVEVVQDQYGSWQDLECQGMKSALLRLEENGTGRVRLADFYTRTQEGGWMFTESRSYLQSLGALDESIPSKPRVIIPNYMNGASNCLATTGFYSVCCINECEGLLAQVESHFATPVAPPAELAAFVGALSSATVAAPRKLSSSLLGRLEEVASHHGGLVPLHGRLFSQWLHHAFPRECPFPHHSGTTTPMTSAEWLASKGELASASNGDLEDAQAEDEVEDNDVPMEAVPWSGVEELLETLPITVKTVKTVPEEGQASGWSLRYVMKMVMLLAILAAMLRGLTGNAVVVWFADPKDREMLLPMARGKQHCL